MFAILLSYPLGKEKVLYLNKLESTHTRKLCTSLVEIGQVVLEKKMKL